MANNFLLPNNTAPTSNTRLGVVKIGTGLDVNTDGTLTLSNSGITAGTYKSITVDSMGRVIEGTNPTTLSGYGITDGLSNINASMYQSASVISATAMSSGIDATKVLNVKDSSAVSMFSVAQTGLTTIKIK